MPKPRVIREIQVKTTMRYHFKPTKMAVTKNKQLTSLSEHVEKSGNPCTPLAGMYKNSAAAVGN